MEAYYHTPFTLTIRSNHPPTNLEYLNFRSNFVTELKKFNLKKPNSSIQFRVDFSRNNMHSFRSSFDEAMHRGLKVVSLRMSENQLSDELEKRGDTIFKYFSDLTELDLSANNIKTLPKSIFAHLDKLENLNLSRNSLLFIKFQVSHMKHLQVLDLSENLLSQFDNYLQENMD